MPRDIGSALLSPSDTNRLGAVTQKELAEMAALCLPARKMLLREMSEIYFPHDPEHISSLKAFHFFCLTAFRGSNPAFYFDYALWLGDRLNTFHAVLIRAGELAKQHPEWTAPMDRMLAFCGDPTNLAALCDVFFPNYPFEKDEIIREYLHRTTAFCADALASPFPYAHFVALRLEFMRNSVDAPRTKEAVSQCFAQYFSRLYQANPQWIQVSGGKGLNLGCIAWTQYLLQDNQLGEKCLHKFRASLPETTPRQKISAILASGDWRKIVEQKELFRSAYFDALTSGDISWFQGLGWHFFPDPRFGDLPQRGLANPEAQNAFFALNDHFEIQTGTYEELFGKPGFLYAVSAVARPEGIHLLLCHPNAREEIKIENMKFVKLQHSPRLFHGIVYRDGRKAELRETPVSKINYRGKRGVGTAYYSLFDVSDPFMVIADDDAKLHVCDRQDGKWHTIDDFLSTTPCALKIAGGRIYILNRDDNSPSGHFSLSSLRPDGRDRRYHFNNQRFEKKNELDSVRGTVRELHADRANLYFAVSPDHNSGRVYRFELATEKIFRIADVPHGIGTTVLQGDQLLWAGFHNADTLETLDLKTCNIQTLLDLRRRGQNGSIRTPFLVENQTIWQGGNANGYTELQNPPASPLLILPNCTEIFPWTEQGKLFLNPSRYFIVRKKP